MAKNVFKKGQKVRVKIGLKDGDYSSRHVFFNEEMKKLCGTILTIEEYVSRGNISVEENSWNWDIDFIEPAEFSKDLIKDLSIVTLSNGERLIYIESENKFVDLNKVYNNCLYDLDDLDEDGDCSGDKIVKIENPTMVTVYDNNDVREMTVEEISKALGYEVKIVKEK